MSRAERALESATFDHVALSVADLEGMIAFYNALGFDVVYQIDFTPAPMRLAMVRNRAGAAIELTLHDGSVSSPATDPVSAALRQGIFHVALRVTDLATATASATAAGATAIVPPGTNSRGDSLFAYFADPEGNLIELIQPAT